MQSYYKGVIPIINDDPQTHGLAFPAKDGEGNRITYGAVPRDYSKDPQSMFASPSQMKVLQESEWDAWYDEEEAKQSSLEHVFLRGGQPAFVNLDQNGHGYCWAYSTGHSIMLKRMHMRLPLVRLNPHATAAIIKGGADEGGWCGLSGKFARENGYAEEGTGQGQWPLHSRNLQYDTPALRASMAKYKITEDWVDLTQQVYDQTMTRLQLATALFQGNPSPTDFNWWGHSVCSVRWVRIERGSWGLLILNSWKGWGRFGLGVLQGSKAIANSAISTRLIAA